MRWMAAASAAMAAWMAFGPATRRRPIDGRLVVATVGVALAGASVGLGAGADVMVAIAIGTVAGLLVPGIAASRARRRRQSAQAIWPDFLATLRARLAAGEPLPAATRVAAQRSGRRFERLAHELEPPHAVRGFAATLAAVRAEWDDPIADKVLGTLAIAADSGGSRVDEVLAALSASVADELRLRLAHEAATTQQRLTALVALVAPWVLLLLTVATNPAAAAAFAAPGGRVVVGGGLAATVTGFVLTHRALRLAETPRAGA